jgi:hypothetical protein
MSKYTMTDAAAKRIAKRLLEVKYLRLKDVDTLLDEEGFTGSYRAGYVYDLMRWLIENKHAALVPNLADVFIRSHYDLREGIDNLDRGLHQIGILEYPAEED